MIIMNQTYANKDNKQKNKLKEINKYIRRHKTPSHKFTNIILFINPSIFFSMKKWIFTCILIARSLNWVAPPDSLGRVLRYMMRVTSLLPHPFLCSMGILSWCHEYCWPTRKWEGIEGGKRRRNRRGENYGGMIDDWVHTWWSKRKRI